MNKKPVLVCVVQWQKKTTTQSLFEKFFLFMSANDIYIQQQHTYIHTQRQT